MPTRGTHNTQSSTPSTPRCLVLNSCSSSRDFASCKALCFSFVEAVKGLLGPLPVDAFGAILKKLRWLRIIKHKSANNYVLDSSGEVSRKDQRGARDEAATKTVYMRITRGGKPKSSTD
jgi:hypothetical protein